MMPKKQSVSEEPFLNTVARTLGHAAGTITNVAHGLTENLSALPKAASSKVRTAAGTLTGSMGRSPQSKKKSRRTARRGKTAKTTKTATRKKGTTARKRKPAANKPPRRANASNRK
jgi:hypothetical protein